MKWMVSIKIPHSWLVYKIRKWMITRVRLSFRKPQKWMFIAPKYGATKFDESADHDKSDFMSIKWATHAKLILKLWGPSHLSQQTNLNAHSSFYGSFPSRSQNNWWLAKSQRWLRYQTLLFFILMWWSSSWLDQIGPSATMLRDHLGIFWRYFWIVPQS